MATANLGGMAKTPFPIVHKTEVFELIERASADDTTLRRALEALRGGRPLMEVGVESGTVRGDADRRDHIDTHWLGDEHEREVLRRGLLRAVELAVEHRVPIDPYWVFAGDHREVAVSCNDRQVTMIVVTPHPDIETEGEAQPHPRIELLR